MTYCLIVSLHYTILSTKSYRPPYKICLVFAPPSPYFYHTTNAIYGIFIIQLFDIFFNTF